MTFHCICSLAYEHTTSTGGFCLFVCIKFKKDNMLLHNISCKLYANVVTITTKTCSLIMKLMCMCVMQFFYFFTTHTNSCNRNQSLCTQCMHMEYIYVFCAIFTIFTYLPAYIDVYVPTCITQWLWQLHCICLFCFSWGLAHIFIIETKR